MMMIRLDLSKDATTRDHLVVWLASKLLAVPALRPLVDMLLSRFPKADADLSRRLAHELVRHLDNDVVLGNPAFQAFRAALLAAFPELSRQLRDDLGGGGYDPHLFNHVKTIAVAEMLIALTASLHANDKIDAAVHIKDRTLVENFGEWLRLVGQEPSEVNLTRRRELVAEMGRRGYQLNDPFAGRYNAASAVNALISDVGPGGRLVLYVKELQDMRVAERLVEQARAGVRIDFTLYDIDPEILRYLNAALAEEPTLPLTIRLGKGEPKFHGNVVFAEYRGRTQAYVGTNYLWFNQNAAISPSGVSYEAGVLLQGEHARQLLARTQSARAQEGLSDVGLVGPQTVRDRSGAELSKETLERMGVGARELPILTQIRLLVAEEQRVSSETTRAQIAADITRLMARLPLGLPPGLRPSLVANALEPHEQAFAREILEHRGGTITGATVRSFPGIDGTVDGAPLSLKETQGGLAAVLRHASKAEAQAESAGYSGVELFIRAPNVAPEALLDFVRDGPLAEIPRQGTISAITVLTAGGWVRILGGS
jgi:hypothetical protein